MNLPDRSSIDLIKDDDDVTFCTMSSLTAIMESVGFLVVIVNLDLFQMVDAEEGT